jgi:hypothetical protein
MMATEYLEARKDHATADAVDRGIGIAGKFGRRAAASFMDGEGIEFKVIVRVLNDHANRRPQPPSLT